MCLEEGRGHTQCDRGTEAALMRPDEDKENLQTDLGLLSDHQAGGGAAYYGGGDGYGDPMDDGEEENGDEDIDDKVGKR